MSRWIVSIFKIALAVLALVIIGVVWSRYADAAGDVLCSVPVLEVNEEATTYNAKKGGVGQ